MNNMHQQYDPYYMGVDPSIYGNTNMLNPVLPYPGTPMMAGPSALSAGPSTHAFQLNDGVYERFNPGPIYGFSGSSHHTSSAGTVQEYEEDGEGAGAMHGSIASLGGPSRPTAHSQSQSDEDKADSHDDKTDDGTGHAGESPKKKPRVTLARGGACVNCRYVSCGMGADDEEPQAKVHG
jgi:hypothetical protein